jgi:hypothetical protein
MESAKDETEEELENKTRILVNELQEINGIADVSFVTKEGKTSDGARSGEIINLGEIVLTFITTGGLVASINLLKSWIENRKRKIIIETPKGKIDAENLSKEELDKLINLMTHNNNK